jgi:hypothetical protein
MLGLPCATIPVAAHHHDREDGCHPRDAPPPKLSGDKEGSSRTPRHHRQFPCQFAEGISRSSALIILVPRHCQRRHSWRRGGTNHRWQISHARWTFRLQGTSLRPRSGQWTTSAAYVAALLLYLTNGGTSVDDTARQYMRQAVTESAAVAASSGGTMLTNKGCLPCSPRIANTIWDLRWCWPLEPGGADTGAWRTSVRRWELRRSSKMAKHLCRQFCSEHCRICGEIELFLETILE